MKVAIRRVDLSSLARFGCLLGAVAAALPSLLCGFLVLGLVHLLQGWLSGWQELALTVLDQDVARFDLVHVLGLEKLLDLLQVLASVSIPATVLGVLLLALVSGALLALIVASVGLAYNLLANATGGLVVELKATREQSDKRRT